MGASENGGVPLNQECVHRIFHHKPSIHIMALAMRRSILLGAAVTWKWLVISRTWKTIVFWVVSPPRHRVIQCVVLFYLDFKGGKPRKQNEIDVVNDGKLE